MSRLASAKVRRLFETAKGLADIFSKKFRKGRFWRVKVAIREAKEGEGPSGLRLWRDPGAELRGTGGDSGRGRPGLGKTTRHLGKTTRHLGFSKCRVVGNGRRKGREWARKGEGAGRGLLCLYYQKSPLRGGNGLVYGFGERLS